MIRTDIKAWTCLNIYAVNQHQNDPDFHIGNNSAGVSIFLYCEGKKLIDQQERLRGKSKKKRKERERKKREGREREKGGGGKWGK